MSVSPGLNKSLSLAVKQFSRHVTFGLITSPLKSSWRLLLVILVCPNFLHMFSYIYFISTFLGLFISLMWRVSFTIFILICNRNEIKYRSNWFPFLCLCILYLCFLFWIYSYFRKKKLLSWSALCRKFLLYSHISTR